MMTKAAHNTLNKLKLLSLPFLLTSSIVWLLFFSFFAFVNIQRTQVNLVIGNIMNNAAQALQPNNIGFEPWGSGGECG